METVLGLVVHGHEVEVLRDDREPGVYLVEIDGVKMCRDGAVCKFSACTVAVSEGVTAAKLMNRGTFGTRR